MNDRAWVATRKGLFELRRGAGLAWKLHRTSFLGEPVSMLLPPQPGGRMLAALNLGHFGVKLHASDDEGATWTDVTTPVYPPQPASDTGIAWKLVQIWSLERSGETLWAGTLPGGLFRSGDAGASWQLVEPLWMRPERAEWFGGGYPEPGLHSICPHPQRPGEMLVALSCGGVWMTCDDGAHWELRTRGLNAAYMPPERADDGAIQDPHLVARCAGQPDVLWCQHHNGLWRSADNAATWDEIRTAPLSNFGFAVAAHPRDGDTAWFVPAVKDELRVPVDRALAIQRTRDGGRSFEVLREGLPQADCYELVYRHGLAVADDGTSLLMGSTTGSLWSSDDGGERWATVAAHLPPIHAVRFG